MFYALRCQEPQCEINSPKKRSSRFRFCVDISSCNWHKFRIHAYLRIVPRCTCDQKTCSRFHFCVRFRNSESDHFGKKVFRLVSTCLTLVSLWWLRLPQGTRLTICNGPSPRKSLTGQSLSLSLPKMIHIVHENHAAVLW